MTMPDATTPAGAVSFECDPCHEIATGEVGSARHFSGSYGRCETCGRTAACTDCQCPGEWKKAREAAAPGGGEA